MAEPISTPMTGEALHLSVDDLLAPLPETARLGGPGPFVINLSASSAPVSPPAKGIAGCHAHVYQVQRMEDRRPRYRLRLGPFANEDEADAFLKKVREIYPGAFTATADAEDLRVTAALRAKANANMPKAPAEKPRAPPQPIAAMPATSRTPVAPMPAAPTVLAAPPKPAAPAVPAAPSKPAASAIPTVELTSRVSGPVPIPTLSTQVAIPRQAEQPGKPPPSASIPVLRQAAEPDKRVPNVESTQTVRALTELELEDDNASRWFVIQLSQAEEPFDPDTVPNHDIFSVYRLYSVAGIDQGRIVHALRLGFFTEEMAAGAVASYLTAFYDKPTIKRVSAAERDRFAEQSLAPRKDVGATGRHAAIEITSERFVREKRSG
jgi:SPOR domain